MQLFSHIPEKYGLVLEDAVLDWDKYWDYFNTLVEDVGGNLWHAGEPYQLRSLDVELLLGISHDLELEGITTKLSLVVMDNVPGN